MRGCRVLSCRPAPPPKATTSETEVHLHPRRDFLPCGEDTRFISLIHASKTISQFKQIHAQIICCKLSSSSRVTTQLISFCSLRKAPDYAHSIFQAFNGPNVFVFNAFIRALAENSHFESSISHYSLMLRSDVRPDRLTVPFVLKSAAELLDGRLGTTLHGGMTKLGLEFETFVRVSLVDMYVKVGRLASALQLFAESPERNKLDSVLLWNILINGCCRMGYMRKAAELFEAMPERNAGSWNCLINGYMKQGEVVQASKLFDLMAEKNVVSWTTMVAGFSQIGDHEKALSMFFKMLEDGVRPNDHTLVSAISACTKLGALESGVRIHRYISDSGFHLKRDIRTALVDMYAKCGNVESANTVFSHMKYRDLRAWSVMIWGWAIHGHSKQAIQCFDTMTATGIKPDGVVFLALLAACSHSGKLCEGLNFFDRMRFDYSIEPTMKHYALVVDLFCRAGRLNEAFSFIMRMPLSPDFVIWGVLFCACRAQKNVVIAELASERLSHLAPSHPGSFVFLSNIFAGTGRWEEVKKVRDLMKHKGVQKDPGWSYIEVGGQVHSFVSGDFSHEHAREMDMKLEEITAHMPETEWVLRNIEEEGKEDALGRHNKEPQSVLRLSLADEICQLDV